MTSTAHGVKTRWGFLLAIAFTIYAVPQVAERYTPNTWLFGDGGFYLNMQKSLTRYNTLNQARLHPHSWYTDKRDVNDAFSNIALGSSGEWWPKHSYIMPVVALPFYWLLGVPGTLVFNVLTMLGMIVLSYQLAKEFFPDKIAVSAALTLAFTGPFVEYSYNFSNDGFQTVLLLSTLLALSRGRNLAGGIFFGIAIWTKITSVLLGPLVLGWLIWKHRAFRPILHFSLAAACPVLLFALTNWYMFGAPWLTGYHRVLIVESGTLKVASHTNLFDVPFKRGLKDILIAKHNGLLTAYPAFALGWLGFIPMLYNKRTRWLAAVMLPVLVGLVLFYAPFRYYQERFLFPWFCLTTIPMAALIDGGIRLGDKLNIRPRNQVLMALGVLAGIAGGQMIRAWTSPPRLSTNIEDARVYLGKTRCDYFNNMRWSWECTGKDRNDSEYVGVNANQRHRIDGQQVKDYIFVRGHHTRKYRRIIFPGVELTDKLTLKYGLDDDSKPKYDTKFVVHVGGEKVHDTVLRKKGVLYETTIDTSEKSAENHDVVITVYSERSERSRLIFDGWF